MCSLVSIKLVEHLTSNPPFISEIIILLEGGVVAS